MGSGLMPVRRRRKGSCRGQVEDDLLKNQRWAGLNEQHRLEAIHHSAEENEAARRRCRQLLTGGVRAVDWF